MNISPLSRSLKYSGCPHVWVMVCLYWFFATTPLFAQGQKKGAPNESAICESAGGVLFSRDTKGAWQPIGANQALPENTLLVSLFSAELKSAGAGLSVTMVGDVGLHPELNILESAIKIEPAAGVDLSLVLERGLVILANQKKTGAVKARITLLGEPYVLQLPEPGNKIAVEVFGRHAPGVESIKSDSPARFVRMLVVRGEALISQERKSILLKAPPGPAMLFWDNVTPMDAARSIDSLPAVFQNTAEAKKLVADLNQSAKIFSTGDYKPGIADLLKRQNKTDKLVAVTALGAVDDLDGLWDALAKSSDPIVREQAILVLRHWLGRQPGQLKLFYNLLTQKEKLSVASAKSVEHLLLGLDSESREQPQTYEALVGYLDSPQEALRVLAIWHLSRLVPNGRGIGYDPTGEIEQRRAAQKRWLELVHAGPNSTGNK